MTMMSKPKTGMSAAKIEIQWDRAESRNGFSAPVKIVGAPGRTADSATYTRALSSAQNAVRCPHCESIIYSRRAKLCGVCDQTLPQEMLFSPNEAGRIETLLAQERQRHKRWMERNSVVRS